MCGINAYISNHQQEDPALIQRMNSATLQRGPDATDYRIFHFENEKVHLGSNRLKIIDLYNQGNQPMVTPDGRYAISYNGEIYNYATLRIPLHKKYKFISATDTEVLLYHLIEHGVKGLSQLEGMFAFVFIDTREEKIIVARDRSGIKPVFYATPDSALLISSEIKGILASGKVEKILNHEQLAEYLHFKSARQPETFFKGIKELSPGHLLEFNKGQLEIRPWYLPSEQERVTLSRHEALLETEKLLLNALEKHLRADVPAGLLLSGGVDSTLLLSLLNKLGVKNFPVLTLAHQAGTHTTEDHIYAQKAAEQYGAEMHTLQAEVQMLSRFQEHISYIDQPVGDSAALMTFLLSEEARRLGIKVLLSGAGADELFAGYNRHLAYFRYLKLLKNNTAFISGLKKIEALIPGIHGYSRLTKKFISKLDVNPEITWENFCSSEDALCDLIALPSMPRMKLSLSNEEWLHKGLQDDRERYLVSDILAITDRMSMARSVEVRVPYLDDAVINFSDSLRPSYLLQHGRKWILKELLSRNQGQVYASRKKEGFGLPFQYWLKQHGNHPMILQVKNPNAIIYQHLSYEKVQEILNLHQSGKRNLSTEIWTLVVLTEWLEQQFA